MGDFYETFDDDAVLASRLLGIALTSRPMGGDGRVPLAGVPHHQLERYLDRLVAAGHRVAIVEQVGDPAQAKGIVERRVARIVTPGTVDGGALLEAASHNWLVAAVPAADGGRGGADGGATGGATGRDTRRWGLAACDVTTGELELQVVSADRLPGEWERLAPRELLLPAAASEASGEAGGEVGGRMAGLPAGALVTERPAREFEPRRGARRLIEQLRERSGAEAGEAGASPAGLEGYGLEGLEAAIGAAGALIGYLRESWPQALAHLRPPRALRAAEIVHLDPPTRRNLGLSDGSLVAAIDRTETAAGGRLLRARLALPRRRAAEAEALLDEVACLTERGLERETLRRTLRGLPDLERLLGRVRAATATARHLLQLRRGLERMPELRAAMEAATAGGADEADEADPGAHAGAGMAAAAERLAAGLGGVVDAAAVIAAAVDDDPPARIADGGTVRPGFDAEVDRLRALAAGARERLAALEAEQRERSGIASLRVGYHRVYGYYLEAPRAQAGAVPEDYEPRQTLANNQRFRYPPLTELEREILGAGDALIEAERAVMERLRVQVAAAGPAIERAAGAAARLDVSAALAALAVERGYTRPRVVEGGAIEITAGRHPIVEAELEAGSFVPNDVVLGGGGAAEADIVVLTGPNMSGKSTYLRQAALIVLLAQCGSYVPAERARIAAVDRIFTRVGAHDELAAGRSTFMVEMLETAAILHAATERSLVIFDEVGRGTSTYDGLAIARAVIEHLHHRPGGAPRTLFATHFHELTELARLLPRVTHRSVAVREEGGAVVFLHRIVDGGDDRSYGVHVAALAGMPRAVVARARELLHELERARLPAAALDGVAPDGAADSGPPADGAQLVLPVLGAPGPRDEPLIEALAALEPDTLSPFEALQRLYELRGEARERLLIEG